MQIWPWVRNADHRGVCRNFDIGVIQHHQRRVAAQFQGHAPDAFASGDNTADIASHIRRTGEGNQARHRVLDEGIADFRACADHDVERTLGEAGFFEQVGDQQAAGHRCVAGGLEHNRVAQGE